MIIDNKLIDIMSEVFKVDKTTITPDTKKDDIENWDSLEHIKLLLEIETNYNIRFDLDIIPELLTAKKLQEEINKLLGV